MDWATAVFGSICAICITVMVCVFLFVDRFTDELNKDNNTRTK